MFQALRIWIEPGNLSLPRFSRRFRWNHSFHPASAFCSPDLLEQLLAPGLCGDVALGPGAPSHSSLLRDSQVSSFSLPSPLFGLRGSSPFLELVTVPGRGSLSPASTLGTSIHAVPASSPELPCACPAGFEALL